MRLNTYTSKLKALGCGLAAAAGIASLSAQTFVGTIPTTPATNPNSITGWKNGNFLITSWSENKVYEMTPSGAGTSFSFNTTLMPLAVATDKVDSIWTGGYILPIDRYNAAGVFQGSFLSPALGPTFGLTYNPNTGNLYSTSITQSIYEFTTAGTLLAEHPLTTIQYTNGLSYDSLRNSYWVNDSINNIVYEYDSAFAERMSFTTGSYMEPGGIGVVGSNLYLVLPFDNQVVIFSLPEIAGAAEEEIDTPAPSGPKPQVVIDAEAIQSLVSSGHFMAYANQYAALHAATSVDVDLNDRLLRWRSFLLSQGGGNQGTAYRPSDTQLLSKVLNMTGGMNMDHRVALGLREGTETTYHTERSLWVGSVAGMMGGHMTVPGPEVRAVVAAPLDAKNPVDGKDVITEGTDSRLEIYTAGDFNAYSQDQLNKLLRGFDTDTYAGTAGLEYRILPWLMAGAGWSYVTSDTELDRNLGGIDLDGQIISAYTSAVWNRFFADAKYSYGGFDHETSRNTLMGGTAQGDTNSWVHNFVLNTGYTMPVRRNLVTGPIATLHYATGGVSGYSETGGGAANVAYSSADIESMIMHLGWQVSARHELPKAILLGQVHAGWEKEFMPQSDTITASLVNSPFVLVNGGSRTPFGSFEASASSAHPGTDWLSLGGAVRLDFISGWNSSLNYETQLFREDALNHNVSLKVSRDF